MQVFRHIHGIGRRLSWLAVSGTLTLALGACATAPTLPPKEASIVAPIDAMIIPPPGGPGIVRVVSKTFPNAVQQDIFLNTQAMTAGENKITILKFEGRGGDGSDLNVRDIPFTEVNLTEEANAAWPGAGMAVSPYYVQNDYGPFGYAIGRPANGDACIYAWQRIEPGLKPSGALERGAINVRLQLCKPRGTEQELVEVMYRLRLNSSVFPPAAAPAAIGQIRAPMRPVGAEGFAKVINVPDPAPVTRPVIRRAVVAPAVVPIAITPAPGAPIVPSPGNTSGAFGPTVPRPSGGTTVAVPTPTSQGN
jgi:hypothetical protein